MKNEMFEHNFNPCDIELFRHLIWTLNKQKKYQI